MAEMPLPSPQLDGLETPTVGAWTKDKHHYLWRYIDIFTTGMKNSFELHYVDLFAGTGIAKIEDSELLWGSPLLAAQARSKFHRLHLCERDPKKFGALQRRLEAFTQPIPPNLLQGDANEHVASIAAAIPAMGTLSLAFLDPYGLHLNFETIRTLTANHRRVDLLIYFPDRVDILRNFDRYAADAFDTNLDRFLGTDAWRNELKGIATNRRGEVILKIYQDRLRSIGYEFSDSVRISRRDDVPLYQLVFCSRHVLGAKFWKEIKKTEPDGQRQLNFGD